MSVVLPIMQKGPIIVLEDDPDDQKMLREAFHYLKVKNELKFFPEGQAVLDYLYETRDKPFVIISNINLPGMSGLELRKKILENEILKKKAVPYIFLSTAEDEKPITEAYDLSVQGYFSKPGVFDELVLTLQHIVDYWHRCKHPKV